MTLENDVKEFVILNDVYSRIKAFRDDCAMDDAARNDLRKRVFHDEIMKGYDVFVKRDGLRAGFILYSAVDIHYNR